MTRPSFVVAGAAKSGTSALTRMLAAHPDVFLPAHVEPHYFLFPEQAAAFTGPGDEVFNRSVTTRWTDYEALFADAPPGALVGESSVAYLAEPDCFGVMADRLPGVRIVLLLRNPVTRAFSAFGHLRLDGREPEADFARALEREDERTAAGWEYVWRYRALGRYGAQVERLYAAVPAQRVLVLRHDDFRRDPAAVVRRAYAFLGLDSSFTPDVNLRVNVSGVPRSARLHRFVSQPGPLKAVLKRVVGESARRRLNRRIRNANLRTDHLPPPTARALAADFAPDLRRLQELTGWDVTDWLDPDRYR